MSNEKCDQTGLLAEHRPDQKLEHDKTISLVGQESKRGSAKPGNTKNAERLQKKYQAALRNLPPPGRGCHPALLGVANLGVNAGYSRQQIFDDIDAAIPHGSRIVPDAEIWQAIDKAFEEPTAEPPRTPKQVLKVVRKLKRPEIKQAVLQSIIDWGGPVNPDELYQHSPVPLNDTEPHMITLLRRLYSPGDQVFIGRRTDPGVFGDSIRKASEWISFFQEQFRVAGSMPEAMRSTWYNAISEEFPHIMPNPLSGLPGKTKTGKDTFRGDSCIKDFRFAVGEFDALSIDKQLSFWRGLGLPVNALIHSGGKSIHAWLRVDGAQNAKDWERIVEQGLFPMLGSLGADTSCRNESRLSRLPGVLRSEKNQSQSLIWLCPEGRVI